MKGLKPLSNEERQARFRSALAQKNGQRLTITLSREGVDALQVIQQDLKSQKLTHTKRAAIEAALMELAYGWTCD